MPLNDRRAEITGCVHPRASARAGLAVAERKRENLQKSGINFWLEKPGIESGAFLFVP
jgi:hypothetical protein